MTDHTDAGMTRHNGSELAKLRAETAKLMAETAKIEAQTTRVPYVALAKVVALLGVFAALVKLLA